MTTEIGFILVFLVLNCISMFVFYRILRKRFSKSRILADVRSEVDTLIIDLEREADRDVALLESRIQSLRALINEADKRIVLADRENEKRQEAAKIIDRLQRTPKPEPTYIPEPAPKPEPAYIPEPATKPDVVQTEPSPITVYTRPLVQRSEQQIKPVVPLHERVLDMARKGISPEMIASTMSVSLGEVELILDMNNSSL